MIHIDILDSKHRILNLWRRRILLDHLFVVAQCLIVLTQILIDQPQLRQCADHIGRLGITVDQPFERCGSIVEPFVAHVGSSQFEHRVVDILALAVSDNGHQRLDFPVVLIH